MCLNIHQLSVANVMSEVEFALKVRNYHNYVVLLCYILTANL